MRRAIDLCVRREVYARAAGQEGIAYLEDPNYHDLQQVSSQSVQNAPFVIANGLTSLIQSVSLLVSFFGLLLFLSPLLAALVLLSAVPYLLIHLEFGRDRFKLAFDISSLQRDSYYYSYLLTGLPAALEMRLFGLKNYLLDRWQDVARHSHQAQMKQSKTSLLISHRFSTVKLADQIVVLDNGCIAETGCHEQLLAQNGVYAGLYDAQAGLRRRADVQLGISDGLLVEIAAGVAEGETVVGE